MPVNQTLIAAALSFLIAAPSYANSQSFQNFDVYHRVGTGDFGSFSHGYLGSATDSANTEWSTPKTENEAAVLMVRELLASVSMPASDLKRAISVATAFFNEKAILPPDMVRILVRHDPEDGAGYLRLEFPISVTSIEELAELDFSLAMRVATVTSAGTDNFVVSLVQA